jgi:hypothetical protein
MYRQVVVICWLFVFALQSFNKVVIILDYYTNTSSFAKNCENKNKPAMHCNGKCQMMKKIKEAEKKEQHKNDKKQTNSDWTFRNTNYIIVPVSFQKQPNKQIYLVPSLADPSYGIFHPPLTHNI